LYFAVRNHSDAAVQLLLEKAADPTIKANYNIDRLTAGEYARFFDTHDLAILIRPFEHQFQLRNQARNLLRARNTAPRNNGQWWINETAFGSSLVAFGLSFSLSLMLLKFVQFVYY
jgi:hypothetical protein